MTTTEQMAQVLEDAAQLYQDEKVEWCSGTWGGSDDSGLSVCAATAIGLASGLGWIVPSILEEYTVNAASDLASMATGFRVSDVRNPYAMVWSAEADALYRATRSLLDGRLNEPVPEFNDAEDQDDNPVRTKQEIIDLFKDTAKELRNGNQG